MSDDLKPQKALIPILILIIIILLVVVAFQTGKNRNSEPDTQSPPLTHRTQCFQTNTDSEETLEPIVVQSGEKLNREMLKKQGVRLTEAVGTERLNQEHLKKSVEEQKVYDSLLRWTMYGKVEDKKWGVRALLN
ncbi:MAG: hypothetical protein LBL62_09130, partial [Planctomycetaceae bacterium]|nr:hypothetical protein [Planctomycetaceae bacterium]